MDNKYLQIGSVVTISENNKKVMIVGYFGVKLEDEVKTYDYIGIDYPEGTLLNNKYMFNQSNITNILFEGYKDESYEVFNKNISKDEGVGIEDGFENDIFPRFDLDSNENVDYNEFESDEIESLLVDNQDDDLSEDTNNAFVVNKINDDENNNIDIKEKSNNDLMDSINIDIPTYKFTEDGIIINE